jgi:metal-sulfur cluster biosynthetic enzyme
MSDESINNNRPEWKAERSYPELATALREGLKEIMDPEIGLNIIQLGLIRDVDIDESQAQIKMILTTPFCPYGPAMLETTQKKAAEVLKRPTNINLIPEMWDFTMMEEGLGGDWGIY